MPVGRETPVSFRKNTGYLQFIISCQQSDVLKTVSIKLPYTVTSIVSSQQWRLLTNFSGWGNCWEDGQDDLFNVYYNKNNNNNNNNNYY